MVLEKLSAVTVNNRFVINLSHVHVHVVAAALSVYPCILTTLDPSAAEWKSHSEYYNCSKYEENKEKFNPAEVTKARKALKKYLFYYERVREHQVGCV